jgi:sugar/nucleoside kinase (ribokinase family)
VRQLTGETDLEKGINKLSPYCKLLVVKNGHEGSYGISNGKMIHQEPIKITPVDTTGAGDCFDSGFIKGWLMDLPLSMCLKWGNIAGGLSTLARGGTGYYVGEKEIKPYLSS